jgi:UDP-N-acetylmuramate--alanine ligase
VVTNVDKEHMDYFKTFKNVIKTFRDFILKLPKDGFLVANKDDTGTSKLKIQKFRQQGFGGQAKPQFKIQNYSLKQPEAKKIKKILKIPGKHNVSNGLAVLAVARILGIKDSITFKSLSEYKGSWRRFEIKNGSVNSNPSISLRARKIIIVSDYAHHPAEILATLKAAREKYPDKKIWCIFQPHQYQRTFYLLKDFVKVLRQVPIDNIIITDIYDVAGREEEKISSNVNSENLVKKTARKKYKIHAT